MVDLDKSYLQKKLSYFCFFIICIYHLVFWSLGPALVFHSIPFDTAEGFAWGMQWQFGYDKHPFIAPWLTALFGYGFGKVGFSTFLLSQFAVVMAYFAIFILALNILSPMEALIAILLLETIDFYTLNSVMFSPDPCSLMTWAWSFLAFYKALEKNNFFWWISVGVFSGVAILSKYTAVLMIFSMFFFVFFNEDVRRYVYKKGIFSSIISLFLVFSPHLFWLIHYHFPTIKYLVSRGDEYHQHGTLYLHLINPIRFLLEQALRFIPAVIIFSILLWPFSYFSTIFLLDKDKDKDKDKEDPFQTVIKNQSRLVFKNKYFFKNFFYRIINIFKFQFQKNDSDQENINKKDCFSNKDRFLFFSDSMHKKWLLTLLFIPFLLTALLSLIAGVHLYSGWAFPFFTLSTITLVFYFRGKINFSFFPFFISVIVFISFAYLLGKLLVPEFHHKKQEIPNKYQYPMPQIANFINHVWQEYYPMPLKYVIGSRYLTAFMTTYIPSHPIPFFDCSKDESLWLNRADLSKNGAMFVWWEDEGRVNPNYFPKNFQNICGHLTKMHYQAFYAKGNQKPIWIAYAILPKAELEPS